MSAAANSTLHSKRWRSVSERHMSVIWNFGKRHPSHTVLSRLAEVLGLERSDLFFLANPSAVELLKSKETANKRSAWD